MRLVTQPDPSGAPLGPAMGHGRQTSRMAFVGLPGARGGTTETASAVANQPGFCHLEGPSAFDSPPPIVDCKSAIPGSIPGGASLAGAEVDLPRL